VDYPPYPVPGPVILIEVTIPAVMEADATAVDPNPTGFPIFTTGED
jgi:hypothetical protein